jgi:SAM-dependent methyltransferase
MPTEWNLSAKLEPFDSYWQAPEDVEKGFSAFYQYYKSNYLKHLPPDRTSEILVVSCGPGYLVKLLNDQGYTNVLGIDSDPTKLKYAERRRLNCRVARAFPYLEGPESRYDLIICEQELNHLTKDETLAFLALCRRSLRTNGTLFVYGLNGANPLTGSESLAQNIDHFNTFTEYSIGQILEYSGFEQIQVFPLKLYVFYRNPLNYVGLLVTSTLELAFRILFKIYGKSNRIFSKKIAAVCRKPA